MAGVNKVILVGNLGNDPEIRHFESGNKVARISLATTEYRTDRQTNERIEMTEWHNVVLWRGLAEVAEKYLKKGQQVYVEGKLRSRSWQDQEGKTNYITEIVADQMTMLGRRNSNQEIPADAQHTPQAASVPESAKTEHNSKDDLRF